MIRRFMQLEQRYASQEVSLDDLKVIQASELVSFDNRGISRSKKDCLLCEIHFETLQELITKLTSTRFPSIDDLDACINESGLLLVKEYEDDCLSYVDEDKEVEIIATICEDGSIIVDKDDVEALYAFSVYLRIGH